MVESPSLRRPAKYAAPMYHDPNDKRMVQIIGQARRSARMAVNIVGVPFDGAVLGRKGAAGGPAAIRQSLSSFSSYNVELAIGLEGARVFDLGDIVVDPEDVQKAHAEIERVVGRELEETSLLAIVGGDNSVSLPALRAYAKKFGKVGLVVVDSHMDLRGRIGGKPTSGSSYGLAVETIEGLSPNNVAEIGIHGFLNSRRYARKAEKLGITLFTARDVREEGMERVAKKAYNIAEKGTKAVYFSVDLDAVDLSYVSGVSAPSAGGIEARELFDIAHYFGGRPDVKCADIVELAPSLDTTGRSQVVAATSLVYLIAGFSSRGKSRGVHALQR